MTSGNACLIRPGENTVQISTIMDQIINKNEYPFIEFIYNDP